MGVPRGARGGLQRDRFLISLFHRKIKGGIAGTAYVATAGGIPPSMQGTINIGSTFTCPLRLVVQVPGREAYSVTLEVWADPNRPPLAGMTLPVVVDPNDPEHIDVDVKHIPRTD